MAHLKTLKLGVLLEYFLPLQLLNEGDKNALLMEASLANNSHEQHISNGQKQKHVVLYFRILKKETLQNHH